MSSSSASSAYNLLEPILASAARHPTRRALATLNESVSYAQLIELIDNFARHMRANGMDRGARAALAGEHPLLLTILALACARIGCSWVRASTVAYAFHPLRLTHCLHIGPRPDVGRLKTIAVGPAWSQPSAGAPARPFEHHRSAEEPWMIGQSSGTTGERKFMALNAGSVWRRGIGHLMVFTRDDPVFNSMFPPLSTLNLVPALTILARGGTFVFADLADLAGGLRIDGVLGSPNQYIAFMDSVPPPHGPRLPYCVVTGATAGASFFQRLGQYFDAITYLYGSTEAGAICTAPVSRTATEDARFGVGRAHPETEVQIVDDGGTPLPPGTEGHVRVRSQALGHGYVGEPELTARIFRDGWFHPGDLGTLTAAGELFITGRAGDLMNIGGVKLNPALVDEAVRAVPGVVDAACLTEANGSGIDRLVAAVVPAGPSDLTQLAPAIRAAVADRLGPAAAPRRLYLVNAIPRNENGKTQRHLLPAAVRAAPFTEVDPSP